MGFSFNLLYSKELWAWVAFLAGTSFSLSLNELLFWLLLGRVGMVAGSSLNA